MRLPVRVCLLRTASPHAVVTDVFTREAVTKALQSLFVADSISSWAVSRIQGGIACSGDSSTTKHGLEDPNRGKPRQSGSKHFLGAWCIGQSGDMFDLYLSLVQELVEGTSLHIDNHVHMV